MCSGPVSTITELGPMIGAIGELPAPDGATSGGAVNNVLTASGSLTITSFIPLVANVSVNASPMRLAHWSITHVGATAHASVCNTAEARGPGGRRTGAAGPAVVFEGEEGEACRVASRGDPPFTGPSPSRGVVVAVEAMPTAYPPSPRAPRPAPRPRGGGPA